jgi:hypothetical protein
MGVVMIVMQHHLHHSVTKSRIRQLVYYSSLLDLRKQQQLSHKFQFKILPLLLLLFLLLLLHLNKM